LYNFSPSRPTIDWLLRLSPELTAAFPMLAAVFVTVAARLAVAASVSPAASV